MRIRCNRRRRCGCRRSLHTMEFDVGFVPCASREPKGSMPALGARPGASRDRARTLLGASNRGQIHPAHPETPRARISDNHKLRRSPCDLAKFWLFSGFVHKLASGFDGDLSEVTLFRAQALRVKRYSYWICVRRKRAGADGGFTAVQLHADKNRRAPHGHVADPTPASSRSRSNSSNTLRRASSRSRVFSAGFFCLTAASAAARAALIPHLQIRSQHRCSY